MLTQYEKDTHITSKKYIVEKILGDTDEKASYFVIKSGDQPFKDALLYYARSIMEKDPKLSSAVIHLARYNNYDAFDRLDLPIKYKIFREENDGDGEELDRKKYFVFRFDNSKDAQEAMMVYADSLINIRPKLSKDIQTLAENRSWYAFGIK